MIIWCWGLSKILWGA